jgi:tRNA modification GTPase
MGIEPPRSKPVLKVATKADLGDVDPAAFDHILSTRTGKGMADLVEAISARAANAAGSVTNVLPSRARHVQLLKESVNHIGTALLHRDTVLELAAEELRLASDALGRITGAVDVEDLLDVIFSQFCIGK